MSEIPETQHCKVSFITIIELCSVDLYYKRGDEDIARGAGAVHEIDDGF